MPTACVGRHEAVLYTRVARFSCTKSTIRPASRSGRSSGGQAPGRTHSQSAERNGNRARDARRRQYDAKEARREVVEGVARGQDQSPDSPRTARHKDLGERAAGVVSHKRDLIELERLECGCYQVSTPCTKTIGGPSPVT